MIIYCGASVDVISEALWDQLKKRHIKCVTKRSTKKLYAFGAVKPPDVVGTFTTDIILRTKCASRG